MRHKKLKKNEILLSCEGWVKQFSYSDCTQYSAGKPGETHLRIDMAGDMKVLRGIRKILSMVGQATLVKFEARL